MGERPTARPATPSPARASTSRAGRGTNQALLLLLVLSFGSGAVLYALGTGWARWAAVAHCAFGLGLLVLSPWKRVVAARGLGRDRPGRGLSILFAVLTVVVIATGVGHSTGWLRTLGPITALQVHVTAALTLVPLTLWHVVARRVRWRRTDLSRRRLLQASAVTAGSLAAFGAVEGIVRVVGAPGRTRRFTGSFERGSFDPGSMPATQWLDDRPPELDPATWRVTAFEHGSPAGTWSIDDLAAQVEPVQATLDCTGGWYSTQRWDAVPLHALLAASGGRSIAVRSATGYVRRFPAADAPQLWLAVGAGGEPLLTGHGAPVRLVAPGRRGFWWVKWVTSIHVDDTPWWWQPPFPLT
jgi:hypothetical protein